MRSYFLLAVALYASTGLASEIALISEGATLGQPSTDRGANIALGNADDRYFLLDSTSTNIVPDWTTGTRQVVRFDRQTDTRVIVSQRDGELGNGISHAVGISRDGRYAVFSSTSTNLVFGSPAEDALYRKDLSTGTLVRIGQTGFNGGGIYFLPRVAANGRTMQALATASDWIAGAPDEFRALTFDFQTGLVSTVTTLRPLLADTFISFSDNVNCFAYTSQDRQLWLRRPDGTELQADVPAAGGIPNGVAGSAAISADCRFVAFHSSASNLIASVNSSPHVYRYDALGQQLEWVSAGSEPLPTDQPATLTMSPNGRHIYFSRYGENAVAMRFFGYRYGYRDMLASFAIPMPRNDIDPVSIGDSGAYQAKTYLPFDTDRNQELDLLWSAGPAATPELLMGPVATTPGMTANGSSKVSMEAQRTESRDGRYYFFASNASNLVLGASQAATSTDLFVRDMQTHSTQRVLNVPLPIEGDIEVLDVSGDARFVLFSSTAANLVAGDNNRLRDIFLVDRQSGMIERVNVTSNGQESDLEYFDTGFAAVSDDGRRVVFSSPSSVLSGGANGALTWFLRERNSGVTRRLYPPNFLQFPVTQFSTDGSMIAYRFTTVCPTFLLGLDGQAGGCVSFPPGGGVAVSSVATLSRDLRFALFFDPIASSVLIRDIRTNDYRTIPVPQAGMRLSADGRYVEYNDPLADPGRLRLFDTLLGTWIEGQFPVSVMRDPAMAQGTWLNAMSNTDISSADLNRLPDLYRMTLRGDGIHGGGWQGGFE